jgi:hypothetical protein
MLVPFFCDMFYFRELNSYLLIGVLRLLFASLHQLEAEGQPEDPADPVE